MDQAVIERLQQKSVSESLIERLRTDFNLAPMVSRTLVEEVSCFYDQCSPQRPGVGQMAYLAVSKDSPAGQPLRTCKRQPVILTLHADEDLTAMKAGMAALRHVRIQRVTEEAYEQGALLTHEDLACLLSSSLSTIKRDVQALRKRGLLIPTRGQIKDIGKGVSHKRQIVQDYLTGYTFSQIERRQRHSVNAINRYCRDFVRVVRLQERAFDVAEIRRVTGLSERLVVEYQALYTTCEHDNDRLQLLLAENGSVPDAPAAVKRGSWLR